MDSLCSLENKIRIFIAATVDAVWLKGIKCFLIKSWITDNWHFPVFQNIAIMVLKVE